MTALLRSSKHFSRVSAILVAAIMATLVATAATTRPAAAENMGDGDPHQSGCDTSAINLATREHPDAMLTIRDPANGAVAGYGYLRYSTTCQSEWFKVTYNPGYTPASWDTSFWLQNQTGTDLYVSGYAPWGGLVWTWMYRNMKYRVGCAGTQMYRSPDNGFHKYYMGWYYMGCA